VTLCGLLRGYQRFGKNGAYVFSVEVTCTLKMERVNFSKLRNYVQDYIVSWTGREN